MDINELTHAIDVRRRLGPGLLIHFHEEKLVDGLQRIVNGY